MKQGTKIFGMVVPISQNYLVAGLLAIVAGVAAYNFLGSANDDPSAAANGSRPAVVKATSLPTPSSVSLTAAAPRRVDQSNKNKQGVLRLKLVDPNSVVDPTLRLDSLERVRAVKPIDGGRNLFETGPDLAQNKLPGIPVVKPMPPKPTYVPYGPQPPAPKPPAPPVNIPLRYYGFVRPTLRGDGNRGYFMDGENILMATEGDVLESRFLIVALTPNNARVEDIQAKQGQDLPLIPEAVVAQ